MGARKCCSLPRHLMLEIAVDPHRKAPLEDWPDVCHAHDQIGFSCCLGLPMLSPWATADIADSVLGDRAARKRFGFCGQLKMCCATLGCPCAVVCCPGDVLCCYYSHLIQRVGEKLGKEPSTLGACAGNQTFAGLRYHWTCGGYGTGRQQSIDGVFVCPVPCLAACTLSMVYAESYKAKTGRLTKKRFAADGTGVSPPLPKGMVRETSPPLQEIV